LVVHKFRKLRNNDRLIRNILYCYAAVYLVANIYLTGLCEL
jgi:hypothetical protein